VTWWVGDLVIEFTNSPIHQPANYFCRRCTMNLSVDLLFRVL